MLARLNNRWIQGFVLAGVFCCMAADSADAACRRRFRRGGIASGVGEAAGQAVGEAIGDSLMAMIGIMTLNPRLINDEPDEPEPLIEPVESVTQQAATLIGDEIAEELDEELNEELNEVEVRIGNRVSVHRRWWRSGRRGPWQRLLRAGQ